MPSATVTSSSAAATWSSHWSVYAIEAWALGTFMVAATLATVLFELPGSPLHAAIPDAGLRRAGIGLLMGATAMALIYSPWGQRSGAHMNPAVTLAFLSLGRVQRWDALFYCVAQSVGGVLGVLLVWAVAGAIVADPPVHFIVTEPGPAGAGVAALAEFLLSFVLMLAVLVSSAYPSLARYTGVIAGLLVALFITWEAPLSGMSINPARSLASALPAWHWHAFWIYLCVPALGMWLAARVFAHTPAAIAGCAKLYHHPDRPCIHCGQP